MPAACATLSNRGSLRAANEDRVFADPDQGLYLVSDGMGGLRGGEVAAQFVVDTLPGLISERLPEGDTLAEADWRERVRAVIAELNTRVHEADPGGRDELGATLVLVLVRGPAALVAHLGDSRAYLLRQDTLTQLTRDHTIAQLLVSSGQITAEEATTHPGSAQLTRYVGMPGEVLPEIRAVALERSDRLLLCSDGLTSVVPHEHILDVLAGERAPDTACQRLVAAANTAGSADNISVIAVDPQVSPDAPHGGASGTSARRSHRQPRENRRRGAARQ